ncbi:MAG: S-layer homology domain-containing protein, partial [Clostridiaceae bacterium]|nr:S-layer homology domain-containing protein [Clostridiaceae bacterium]
SPAAASPNPFTDTKNPKVLKAFALGITTGTSATVFSPQVLINREQCATMLYRALRVIAPEGGYSIAGIKDFPDQKNISAYAVEGTKYMSKLGIIKGDNNGNFMPKATTTAQEATGYGAATREASILMSVRSYDQIESGALGTPTGDGSATPPLDTGSNAVSYSFRGAIEDSKTSSAAAPEATVPAPDPAKESGELAEWLIGTWGYSNSGGWGSNAHLEMMYEFKKDGTFYKVLAPMISGARTGNVFEGKYKISGDKLTLYDQLKSVGPAKSYFDKIWYFEMESYDTKDVPVEDSEYKISRTDEGTLIMDDVEFKRGR